MLPLNHLLNQRVFDCKSEYGNRIGFLEPSCPSEAHRMQMKLPRGYQKRVHRCTNGGQIRQNKS